MAGVSFFSNLFSPDLKEFQLYHNTLKFFNIRQSIDPTYGFITVGLFQNGYKNQVVWQSNTFQDILSDLGGFSSIVFGFFSILVLNYQNFTFQKSFFKKLFFYLDPDFDGTLTRSDKEEIKERILHRKPFWFGYGRFLCMNCCICWRPCMNKKNSRYYKRYKEFQRFKVAEM